ncbi:hypothetical protein LPJ77_005613 [Coemansia sp. RSA 2523]|nr:hypothetical protein LPJ54_005511 [Coemansia sp. RSA 1824]KAJ1802659.1 hypothetical protein LPJ77_005613 [Coemansia sp. RSA 2523]KAJ2144176.1 hypothetical protein IW142_003304 [Coemansia sp. RSA 564]KAJ2167503.1 hypothetical protein GGH15_002073 [Coemansia sp. RSA 562]KAJ2186101.1 hypothetical protein EV181_003497 [Coemansia sp. RSA 532]KAJ2199188.1 hypothetical protein IW144_001605 [Coemansia sp. RSA 522]KAJ2207762.1 hypothetical protein IW145_001235 [Coemansia sp. RSA 521]KAJ2255811.1 h
MSNPTTSNPTTSSDDYLKTFISKAEQKLKDSPVTPTSGRVSVSMLVNDEDAPKNRIRYYMQEERDEIAKDRCMDAELKWYDCFMNPPTWFDKFVGCKQMHMQHMQCIEQVHEELLEKSGKHILTPESFIDSPLHRDDFEGKKF